MLYYHTNKISIFFLIYLIIIIKVVKGDLEFDTPNALNNHIHGFLGYKCNFSTSGVHNLEPDLIEIRSILCSINSHFIYDKIKLVTPKKNDESPYFKVLPESCFKKVYKNVDRTAEADIADLGLVDYEVNEDNTSSEYRETSITISPFNSTDVEFFCFCDNSEKVISDVKGRTALVHVRALKYPNKIISINLTNISFDYLNDPKGKEDFKNNNLEIDLNPGELLVLACDQIDKKCFQRKNGKELYKSNKIIYQNKFAIFKAPLYTEGEMDAICTCKVDNTQYNVVVKPKNEKKEIHGCDFFTDETSNNFSKSVNLKNAEDNEPVNCEIELTDKKYNHIIGINCPGEIIPNCFFQVYQDYDEATKLPHKIIYLDSYLNVGDIEYYDDIKSKNKIKIFSIVGELTENKNFICLCKIDKKTGYMIVKMASAYYGFLSKIFLFIIVTLILYHS